MEVAAIAWISPEKMEVRRKNPPEKFSGGGGGQWRLPEIGEEGERELGLRFPAQSIRSSNAIALDLSYLLVLIIGMSQSRQYVDTSLIHLESCKSPTAELFDVDSRRIPFITMNTKEYHSECSGNHDKDNA
ncbi:hypothetical protein Tco_1261149 [Tanacetum coccineum]